MHRTVRRLLTTTLAVPVALTAYVATAPGALAVMPELAAFTGGFHTECDLPTEGGQPVSGDYSCIHSATSLECAWVVAAGPVVVENHTCTANLRDAYTTGHAESTAFGLYRCVNGGGTGTVDYTPENGGPTRTIFVWLQVEENNILITGSYLRAEDGQWIVYRATMPAFCQRNADSPTGYQGAVTPI